MARSHSVAEGVVVLVRGVATGKNRWSPSKVLIFPHILAEQGIGLADLSTEVLALFLAIAVLYQRARQPNYRFGILYTSGHHQDFMWQTYL